MMNHANTFERILVIYGTCDESKSLLRQAVIFARAARHLAVLVPAETEDDVLAHIMPELLPLPVESGDHRPEVRLVVSSSERQTSDAITAVAREAHAHLVIFAGCDSRAPGPDLDRSNELTTGEAFALTSGIPTLIAHRDSFGTPSLNAARILLPIDGSVRAQRIVPVASRLARHLHAPIHLVTVIDPLNALPPAYAYLPKSNFDRQDALAALQVDANRALDSIERLFLQQGIDVSSELVMGSTNECLIASVQPGDIVAMTTHGEGDSIHSGIGSTTMAMLCHQRTPILIMRSTASEISNSDGLVDWDTSRYSAMVAAADSGVSTHVSGNRR